MHTSTGDYRRLRLAARGGDVAAQGEMATGTPNVLPASVGSRRRNWPSKKTLTYANHLGLYSEQIGHSGELLTTSQAFTHLALNSAATQLDRELSHPDGGDQPPGDA
jgi:hypothetical protein